MIPKTEDPGEQEISLDWCPPDKRVNPSEPQISHLENKEVGSPPELTIREGKIRRNVLVIQEGGKGEDHSLFILITTLHQNSCTPTHSLPGDTH